MTKLSIYRVVKAWPQVLQTLGGPEPRFYPFGENDDAPIKYPYAVYRVIPGGGPQNYLAHRPDLDELLIQIDVFGITDSQAGEAVVALRDALELHCRIVSWRGSSRDPETKNYRQSFDVRWVQPRL